MAVYHLSLANALGSEIGAANEEEEGEYEDEYVSYNVT